MKQITFLIGLTWLIYGALFFEYQDWNIGVSLLMAVLTYLTAEWSAASIFRLEWRKWPLAAFYAWLSVDGAYWAYWSAVKPSAMMRADQWQASLCLYLLAGFIWLALPMFQEALVASVSNLRRS